jgi:hypothetical protein
MPTQIVFLGSNKDQALRITVEEDVKTVGQMSELAQLTKDGDPIWVNMSNVLYLEEQRGSGPLKFV